MIATLALFVVVISVLVLYSLILLSVCCPRAYRNGAAAARAERPRLALVTPDEEAWRQW